MLLSHIMENEYSKTYEKKCHIIKNLIKKVFPNENFIISITDDTGLMVVTINEEGTVTILPDNNWKEIKRNICKKLSKDYKDNQCCICFDNIKKNVSCNKCSNGWCGNCYISLFRSGKGIIKCPHCRFTFGINVPESMMETCINEIKDKMGKH